MKKYLFLKIKIIFFIFLILQTFQVTQAENEKILYEKIDLFGEVLEKIQDEYVDEIDQSEVIDAAINGGLQSLDPYSGYMSPEVFKDSQIQTTGKFGGLGIEVGMESGVVKVVSPIADTPADRAGIKAGDYIVEIDGNQVQGKTLMEAVNYKRRSEKKENS